MLCRFLRPRHGGNWERGHISGYRLLETTPDSLGDFDLVLMTAYPDSTALVRSEASFQPILQQLRPGGPQLLNALQPADFRVNAFLKTGRTVFAADAKVPRPVKATPPAASRPFLQEINRDIWIPFAEAYATGDADKYLALHTADFIRAEDGDQQTNDLTGYSAGVRSGFQRGIYRYTFTPPTGQPRQGYGQFHVFSRKENGRWKIAVDYDSNEGGTVGEAEFKAGKRAEDW